MRNKFSFKAVVLLSTVFLPLSGQNQQAVVTAYGAQNNGTNPAATTAAFQQAFAAAAPAGKVIVPPGVYAIDNSGGPLTVTNFQGEFKFEGTAQIVFGTTSMSGMLFNQGWGIRVVGFRSSYSGTPTTQVPNTYALGFTGVTSPLLDQAIIQESPSVGVLFSNDLDAKASNVTVLNPLGAGIRFQNSLNAELANATVTGSGTDGVVFTTTAGTSGVDGAHASNITVSQAGGRGISVSGESYVTVNGFTVYSSTSSGIYCGTTTNSAVPNQVLFQGGLISGSAGFGIEFENQASCSFTNIQVINPGNRGVSGSGPGGAVELRNVRVNGNQASDAFNFSNIGTVRISDCTAEKSPGYGFFFDGIQGVVAVGLTAFDVSSQSPLDRAIWFQNGVSALAFDLIVIDDRSTPTGYIVGTSGIQTGALHSIASDVVHGKVVVQNGSPGVNVTNVN